MKPLEHPLFIRSIAGHFYFSSHVSKDFKWSEFFASDTGKRLCIDNTTSDLEILSNIAYLVHYVLQPLRERCGPIRISSGYRCKTLNEAVDGHENSYHLYGRAADIVPFGCPLTVLENFIKDLGVKYVRYSTFIHVQI